jgi:ribosomal protein L29
MAKRKKKEEVKIITENLVEQADTLQKEIFVLRNELAMHRKLEKPHLLKAKRHERARLLTLITQERRKAHA